MKSSRDTVTRPKNLQCRSDLTFFSENEHDQKREEITHGYERSRYSGLLVLC